MPFLIFVSSTCTLSTQDVSSTEGRHAHRPDRGAVEEDDSRRLRTTAIVSLHACHNLSTYIATTGLIIKDIECDTGIYLAVRLT